MAIDNAVYFHGAINFFQAPADFYIYEIARPKISHKIYILLYFCQFGWTDSGGCSYLQSNRKARTGTALTVYYANKIKMEFKMDGKENYNF